MASDMYTRDATIKQSQKLFRCPTTMNIKLPEQPPAEEMAKRSRATLKWIDSCLGTIYSAYLSDLDDDKVPSLDLRSTLSMYTAIHEYCAPPESDPIARKSALYSRGAELTSVLEKQVRAHCARVRDLVFAPQGDVGSTATNLLETYTIHYGRYTRVTELVKHLFRYLERHELMRELGGQLGTTKACEARTIEDLHRKVWKEEILLELHDDAHDLETCGDEMELRAL